MSDGLANGTKIPPTLNKEFRSLIATILLQEIATAPLWSRSSYRKPRFTGAAFPCRTV
jgi:hypothetical protein